MIENINSFNCFSWIFCHISEKGLEPYTFSVLFLRIFLKYPLSCKSFLPPCSALCVEFHVEIYLAQKQSLCSLTWPLPGNSEQGCSCSHSPLSLFWAALSLSYFQMRNNSAHSTITLSSLKHSRVYVGGTGNSWWDSVFLAHRLPWVPFISSQFQAQKFYPWYFQQTDLWLNIKRLYSFICESCFAVYIIFHILPRSDDFMGWNRNYCPHLLLQRPWYKDIHFLEFFSCRRKTLIEVNRNRTVSKGKL